MTWRTFMIGLWLDENRVQTPVKSASSILKPTFSMIRCIPRYSVIKVNISCVKISNNYLSYNPEKKQSWMR